MPIDQIIVSYKLDLTELKQQVSEVKTELNDLQKAAQQTGSGAAKALATEMKSAVADLRGTLKDLSTEIKQTFDSKTLSALNAGLAEHQKHITELATKQSVLNAQYQKAQQELNKLSEAGKKNTAEFDKAEKAANKIESQLKKVSKELETTAKGFDALKTSSQGIKATTELLAKAVKSTGDLETKSKALQKAEKDLATSISAVNKATTDSTTAQVSAEKQTTALGLAKKAYSLIVGESTGALKFFKLALAGTGIGLAVIAIGLLIENFTAIKEKVEEMFPSLKKLEEFIDDNRNTINGFVSAGLEAVTQLVKGYTDAFNIIKDVISLHFTDAKKDFAAFEDDVKGFGGRLAKAFEDGYNGTDKKQDDTKPPVIKKSVNSIKQATKEIAAELEAVQTGAISSINTSADQGLAITKEKGKETVAEVSKATAEASTNTKDLIKDITKAADTAMQSISKLVNMVFKGQLDSVKSQTQAATAELDKWHDHALTAAGNNAQKRAAIEKRFSEQQKKLKQEEAIKEATIKRQQAEVDKGMAIAKILMNTAQSISKYSGDLPASAPLLAEAVITGAVQAALVAAQPLPQIPKFATGVVGFKGRGTTTSDSNLVAISHMESVIAAKPTIKYGEELEAINNMRFEHLLMNKYLLPALQNANASTNNTQSNYDDWLLRKDVREGNHAIRKSAEYIVKGVSEAVKNNQYITSRYHA